MSTLGKDEFIANLINEGYLFEEALAAYNISLQQDDEGYSVSLYIGSDANINISLQNLSMDELKAKVPSYDMLEQKYDIKFQDKENCDIDDDDDLEDAFDCNESQRISIKVIKTAKPLMLQLQIDLEEWLKSHKLYITNVLQELAQNGVTELGDLKELQSEIDIDEFLKELQLGIILRKKLKKAMLTLITQTFSEPETHEMNIDEEDPFGLNYMNYIACPVLSCAQQIPADEYDSHALMHSLHDQQLQQQAVTAGEQWIKCEFPSCNLSMAANEYESHIVVHQLSQQYHVDPVYITCYYHACNKKIAIEQYAAHLAQHKDAVAHEEKKVNDEEENKQQNKPQDGWNYVQKLDGIDTSQKHRAIMVIGATGTGKTTLLNSMANYLWGVKYEDKHRYKLIDETDIQQLRGMQESQTDKVKAYHLSPPVLDYQLTVIDTPGFGDTRGIERDKITVQNIREFFQTQIQEIDAIFFVIRAPQSKLTPTQKYIFDQILGMFGKDVTGNIFVLFTFADNQDPPALAALTSDNVPYYKHFKLNNSGFQKLCDKTDYIGAGYYNMGIQAFKQVFIELDTMKPISLELTKKVMTRREELETYIEGIQPTINRGYSILDDIRKQIAFIRRYADEINANKNFVVEREKAVAKQVPNGGKCTTTCTQCNYTCHRNCAIPDDQAKDRCSAMGRGGNCKVCPDKCHWMKHRNLPYIVEWSTETVEETVEDLKKKYYNAKNEQSIKDQLIHGLEKDLSSVEVELNSLLNNVRDCLNELADIALRPNTLNQGDYIDKLIISEESQKKVGWKERCESLRELKKKQETLNQITNSDYNPWGSYGDVKSYLNEQQLSGDKKDEKEFKEKDAKYTKKKKVNKKSSLLWGWFK